MRKFLSIISAVGLTATAATTVVACGTKDNNPSASLNDVKGWFKTSAVKNENAIIFIGARNDSDSLSYLATTNFIANDIDFKDIDTLRDDSSIKKADNKLTSGLADNKKGRQNITTQEIASWFWQKDVEDITGQEKGSTIAKDFFRIKQEGNNGSTTNKIAFHSLMVDTLESFWKKSLGKNIINDILKEDIKKAAEINEIGNEPNTTNEFDKEEFDKKIKKITKDSINKIKNALSEAKGPYFLILRNGHLAGIRTGYKNYYNFNNKIDKPTDAKSELWFNPKNAIDDFNTFLKEIVKNNWKKEVQFVNNYLNEADTTLIENNSGITEWKASDNWNDIITEQPHKDKDDENSKPSEPENPGEETKPEESEDTNGKTFSYNINHFNY